MKANRSSTYPLRQDVPHSSDLVLFLNGVTIVLLSRSVVSLTLTHNSGRVTQICVFNTVKLGTSASSPLALVVVTMLMN